jgi:hypothetical protein
MFINKIAVILSMGLLSLQAADVMQPKDCSSMSQEAQEFAGQLTPLNMTIFCGQFTDGQRASAMQMASTPDATGMSLSPDMAVQKVAGASGSSPKQKTPTGCPVK